MVIARSLYLQSLKKRRFLGAGPSLTWLTGLVGVFLQGSHGLAGTVELKLCIS